MNRSPFALFLMLAALIAMTYGGCSVVASLKSRTSNRQHQIACAEQGLPPASCCRINETTLSCPLTDPGIPASDRLPKEKP